MADGPSHFVVIETLLGEEMRRLGPMHLGRAHLVRAKMEARNSIETERVRVIDNPNYDPETNQEKTDAHTDEEDQGVNHHRGQHQDHDPGSEG